MRYITGSRILMFGDAISILARSTRLPSGNSPSFMRVNRSRFSSTARLRYGLSLPGSVSVPRCWRISSADKIVDVRLASPDQLQRPLVKLAEVIRRIAEPLPVEAQPADVLLDRIDVLLLFLLGIGVVEAQIGLAAELVGQPEVKADGFGVADMEVTVGLGWKARLHHRIAVLFGAHVLRDPVAEKVGCSGNFGGFPM